VIHHKSYFFFWYSCLQKIKCYKKNPTTYSNNVFICEHKAQGYKCEQKKTKKRKINGDDDFEILCFAAIVWNDVIIFYVM
jgi:hypothetical protein